MNSPAILRLSPVSRPTTVRTQAICETTNHCSSAAAMKLAYLICLFAAATSTQGDTEEWRYFGGLLFGGMLSAGAGVGILLLSGKPVLRQIIIARLIANMMFAVGFGALVVYAAGLRGWHTGPLFTVGAAFIMGICGVGVSKLVEPILKRRAEAATEEFLDRFTPGPRVQTGRAADTPAVRLIEDKPTTPPV